MQAVQIDNLKNELRLKRIDKMRNGIIREKCYVEKGINNRMNVKMALSYGKGPADRRLPK